MILNALYVVLVKISSQKYKNNNQNFIETIKVSQCGTFIISTYYLGL